MPRRSGLIPELAQASFKSRDGAADYVHVNVTVSADDAAEEFIRDQGGRLFVWISDAGLEHETTTPKPGIEYAEFQCGTFSLHIDPAIEMPHRWLLVYHRFPRPHVRALWNGGAYSPTVPYIPPWEGEAPSQAN